MTIETVIRRGHVVALTMAAWGHAKSACALLAKIVRYQPVYATMFIGSSLSEKVVKELDAQFLPDVEADLRKLIRVVALESGPNPFDNSTLNVCFMKEYKKLLNSEGTYPIGEASLDKLEPGSPKLVILDFFLYETLQSIRATSGHSVPVYALQSACAAGVLFMFGPEESGGHLRNLADKLKEITHTDQEAILEESERIFRRVDGNLVKVPGLPPMYDHEHVTQKSVIPKGSAFIIANAHKFLAECDGAVMNTTPLYETESIKAFEEWFNGKPVISAGPFDYPLIKKQEADPQAHREVIDFLDSALETYGPKSVVYISFGSIFWPPEPEKLWTILDVLIEEKVPFIFSRASPFSAIPDDIEEKVRNSGLGHISNWAPQTTVLNHQTCGWILTHCGNNSFTEALSAGVPMICWPFEADQPMNAAMIGSMHNLGYELYEVRSGLGLRPIHRLGDWTPEGTVEAVRREFSSTLEKMNGEDGAVKRANVQKFRDELSRMWAPGGKNWEEIKRIADMLQ